MNEYEDKSWRLFELKQMNRFRKTEEVMLAKLRRRMTAIVVLYCFGFIAGLLMGLIVILLM